MKDDQIIILLKAGNYSKAGEKLYAYFPVIKKLVLKNSGSRQDAEDVYQEALMILIKKVQAGNFVLTSSLNTYLYSVCRFLWSEQLRKSNKTVIVDPGRQGAALTAGDFKAAHRDEKDLKLAENAFRLLGEKCKALLLLFYFKNLSLRDIAVQLKFSSEKVAKNQKYRCIEKAKEHLRTLKSTAHE